jgi:hypothetical protein
MSNHHNRQICNFVVLNQMKTVAKEVRIIFKPLPSSTPLSSSRGFFFKKYVVTTIAKYWT